MELFERGWIFEFRFRVQNVYWTDGKIDTVNRPIAFSNDSGFMHPSTLKRAKKKRLARSFTTVWFLFSRKFNAVFSMFARFKSQEKRWHFRKCTTIVVFGLSFFAFEKSWKFVMPQMFAKQIVHIFHTYLNPTGLYLSRSYLSLWNSKPNSYFGCSKKPLKWSSKRK